MPIQKEKQQAEFLGRYFQRDHCKYTFVSFCPEWVRLINAGEVQIIRTEMACGKGYQEK